MIQKILRNTNVWIGDTVAIFDFNFSKARMSNTETLKTSNVVMACNGKNDKAQLFLIITANKCDDNGNIECRLNMNEVSYTPSYHFNFFGLGKST